MPLELNGTTGASLVESGALPFLVGQVCFFAMDTVPDGFIKCNGAEISRSTYADLFAAIGTTFGSGDGSTTFELPDMRGEFPRGWDDGRGVDSGRAFGTAQLDQMQRHKHLIEGRGRGSTTEAFNSAAYPSNGFGNSGIYNTGVMLDNSYAEDGGGTPRTGSETRPRNIALLVCIKY